MNSKNPFSFRAVEKMSLCLKCNFTLTAPSYKGFIKVTLKGCIDFSLNEAPKIKKKVFKVNWSLSLSSQYILDHF